MSDNTVAEYQKILDADLMRHLSSLLGIPPTMLNPNWRDGLSHWAQAITLNNLGIVYPQLSELILELQKLTTLEERMIAIKLRSVNQPDNLDETQLGEICQP